MQSPSNPVVMRMGGNRRTLIVEDDGLLTIEIEQLLLQGGFAIAGVAADAAEAIRIARDLDPDWALVDLHLRDGLTGPNIGRRLVGSFHIPVLYVTADAQSAPLEGVGIIGMFPKIYYGPDFIDVLKFVDAYLDGRHRQAVAPKFLLRSRA
jgi:two-component system, response regulator PdtaR